MICCAFVRLSNRALNFHVELYEMHEHFISSEFSFDDTGHCRLTTHRHRFARAAPAPRAKRNDVRFKESWTCVARQTGHGSFEIVVQIVSDYDFSLGGSALASISPIS